MNFTENPKHAFIFPKKEYADNLAKVLNDKHKMEKPWHYMESKLGYAVAAIRPNGDLVYYKDSYLISQKQSA